MNTSSTIIDLREPGESDLSWLSILLHTTDSAYPIGGFAHSGGLEGMVALDFIEDEDELRHFLQHEIAETLGTVELPLLYQAWTATKDGDDGLIPLIDEVSEAVRFSAEQRQASRRLGAQRWALLEKLHADKLDEKQRALLARLGEVMPHKHLCVVAGIEAALLGLPAAASMLALSHQSVMMVAQAAMKIMRIGQNSVQKLVTEMAIRYPQLITIAMVLEMDDIGTSLPVFDIATAWHETANARMFLS